MSLPERLIATFTYHCRMSGLNTWAPSNVAPTANRAYYIPFDICDEFTVTTMFWVNAGSVGAANVDVGIYDEDGTRLVSSGAIATAGANVVQVVDVADTILPAGTYYFALSKSATTTMMSALWTLGVPTTVWGRATAAGLYIEEAAHPLPAAAVFASANVGSGSPFIPMMGAMSGASVIL